MDKRLGGDLRPMFVRSMDVGCWGPVGPGFGFHWHPDFREQTVLQWHLLLVYTKYPAWGSYFMVFGEPVHPSETSWAASLDGRGVFLV